MKISILILLLNLMVFESNSQLDSTSKSLLEMVLGKQNLSDTLFYTDKLGDWPIKTIKQSTKRRLYTGQVSPTISDTFYLSLKEKKYLDSSINVLKNYHWPDSLFKNSKRIPEDSMWSHISMKLRVAYESIKKDTTNEVRIKYIGNMARNANVFQFSAPIFFRNKSICFLYTLRLCGASCGTEELAFYKINDGKYSKWFVFGGGEF